MNSHIVEKTMHSIKNIDRLTDLAAIDVYNTTHDTINKYEIMKEHATEEYTNESFYQESVLAGVLIGAGVLGVAVSAFFIIKKIIESKDSADSSVKSADGKMVAAQVDLTDPKSTEKYLSDLSDRLKKLTETKSIKVAKSINKEEFESAEKQIKDWSDKLQNIIDNKHEAAAIEKIIDEISISSVDASKIFVDKEMDADVATFAEALGLKSISSFAALLTQLKKQIDDVEKMVNNKKDKEAENAVEISQDHLTKLKNQNNAAAKLIAALKAKSKETLAETDKVVLGAINAETEAKKKTEEPAENSGGTPAAENKTDTSTGENKTDKQSAADAGSGAGGSDNTGKKLSTSENVMGPGGQTERMKQASEAKQAAEAQNKKDVLYLNPKEDTQKDETVTPVIPAAAEKKANEKTLEDVTNMLKSGQSEEDVRNALTKNNYKTEQIDAFLTEANNRIVNERKSELLNQTLGGTKPAVLDGEVLPPETEAKPFKFPKKGDDTFNNNRQEQGIDKVVENIRRLVPADSEEGSWDKIVPTLKTYGFTDDEINDYAVRNNIIPSKSQDTPAPAPTDQNTGENTQKTTPEQSSENQQQTQPQQTVNQNSNGINIKDVDNIIRQASYDGISKDISESICKNVIDDIGSNTPFDVVNRVKDEAIKLKTDQKLYFTDAAKRILRVYANAIADIEPQTDAVKKYAEDVKQASEMDLSLIEPPVTKQGSLEPPNEYVNKVSTLLKQIPGAIPNKAKELAESEYADSYINRSLSKSCSTGLCARISSVSCLDFLFPSCVLSNSVRSVSVFFQQSLYN